jgi:GNAT superfamily N-acetyltransferase
MPLNFTVEGPLEGQSEHCAPIFERLADWFGIPEAVEDYLREIDHLPTFVACLDGRVIGFLTLKQHFPRAAELYVMGILPEYHRCGMGRALVARAEDHLRALGVWFLQVKTLSSAHPDPFYARTRAFYEGAGFQPLEELPTLWGLENPCLIMVKWIG